MDEVIKYLQTIQDNLVGLILPAVITAAASILTIAINTIINIIEKAKKQNSEQLVIMYKIYPQIRELLQSLWMNVYGVKQCGFNKGKVSDSLKCYFLYVQDEREFRKKYNYENLNVFIDWNKKIIDTLEQIGELIKNNEMPIGPALHPFVRSDVYTMFSSLQRDIFIVARLNSHPNELPVLEEQLKKCELDQKTIEDYIELLDTWLRAYR